jgi:hypothetical protein
MSKRHNTASDAIPIDSLRLTPAQMRELDAGLDQFRRAEVERELRESDRFLYRTGEPGDGEDDSVMDRLESKLWADRSCRAALPQQVTTMREQVRQIAQALRDERFDYARRLAETVRANAMRNSYPPIAEAADLLGHCLGHGSLDPRWKQALLSLAQLCDAARRALAA